MVRWQYTHFHRFKKRADSSNGDGITVYSLLSRGEAGGDICGGGGESGGALMADACLGAVLVCLGFFDHYLRCIAYFKLYTKTGPFSFGVFPLNHCRL
jgi:hypothetical protein